MSLLIDDQGEIVGRQKMVHVAQCEMFYEQSYYTPLIQKQKGSKSVRVELPR